MTNKPSIRIDYSARFKRDLKRLHKKYRSIQNDIQPLIDSLVNGQTPGDAVQHVHHAVYKVRLQNSDVDKGKSGGYRVIYYIRTANFVILITIYAKSDASDVSASEIRRLIEEYDNNQ